MVKNRLFSKMIVIYFCIIISTLMMLGVLLSFLLNNYLIYNKQMEMLVKASDIASLVKPFLVEKHNPADLIGLLNRADKNLGTEIWVIDRRGAVIAASADQKIHEGDLVEPDDIAQMQQGRVSIRQGKSHVYGETVLWVTVPVKSGENVIGGIIMYAPIMGITQTMQNVKNLFIYSAVVSIIFSTIVVYFLSKYVTGPLQEINRVAKQLARGDFSERVGITRNDEIGDLGRSFNYMADEIEKQEKMRRGFVADVSHELRSPLTNIQGFLEAMIDGKDKTAEDRTRYLSIIHKETVRLTGLVNELLDLSRLESGIVPMEKQPVDLTEIARVAAAKAGRVMADKGVKLSLDLPAHEVVAPGNRDRLEQVLTNLLDNAGRYSPGGEEITVRVKESAGRAVVTVADNGPGIPAEDLPYIWERFYKVDKARCRETGGTGLGLAIVRQIIESLGGQVQVQSEEGRGTEIGFALPLSADTGGSASVV